LPGSTRSPTETDATVDDSFSGQRELVPTLVERPPTRSERDQDVVRRSPPGIIPNTSAQAGSRLDARGQAFTRQLRIRRFESQCREAIGGSSEPAINGFVSHKRQAGTNGILWLMRHPSTPKPQSGRGSAVPCASHFGRQPSHEPRLVHALDRALSTLHDASEDFELRKITKGIARVHVVRVNGVGDKELGHRSHTADVKYSQPSAL